MTVLKLRDAKRAEAARKAHRYVGRDGGAPEADVESALGQLGEMAPAEYGRRRHEIAEKIGTPTARSCAIATSFAAFLTAGTIGEMRGLFALTATITSLGASAHGRRRR